MNTFQINYKNLIKTKMNKIVTKIVKKLFFKSIPNKKINKNLTF